MSRSDKMQALTCYILTISDTRTEETDKSGELMKTMLQEAGHRLIRKDIVTDDKDEIQTRIRNACKEPEVDVILTNGGTGVSPRDVTIEAVRPLLDKELPGFGEIFRTLSYYEDIGSSAIMSRAIAGVIGEKALFSVPGSSGAVKLAMEKLILKEMNHVIRELNKHRTS